MARTRIEGDWYGGGIPDNIVVGRDVYIDSAYAFAAFHSRREPALVLGEACGVYDRAALVTGPEARIDVGAYTCLNGTYLVCEEHIRIGAHCLLAWGAVVTDCEDATGHDPSARRAAMSAVARDPLRRPPRLGRPRPVTLEDNVWVGFDAVILPGVTLGRGSVVGCRTVVGEDVPPYAVVVGDPPRLVRELRPDDDERARARVIREYTRRD